MSPRFALAFAFLAAAIPCQVEEVGGEPDVRATEAQGRAGETRQKGGMEKGMKPEEENLTPEQRLARNITSGASAYCRFSVSVTPAKLMPGQTGTLKVLAALQGTTVLPAPAPMELMSQPQQGALTLGAMVAQPAAPGRLAPAYVGRPVYDNYAIFELPVTMAADAPMGSKHVASVDMRFDLFDGNSAQPIGRFLDRVGTEIEVGRVADPAVNFGAAAAAAPDAEPAPAGASASAAPTPAAAQGGAPARTFDGKVLVADETPAAPSAAAPESDGLPALPSVQPGGLPTWLLAGGGVVVLLVVILLLRRK